MTWCTGKQFWEINLREDFEFHCIPATWCGLPQRPAGTPVSEQKFKDSIKKRVSKP